MSDKLCKDCKHYQVLYVSWNIVYIEKPNHGNCKEKYRCLASKKILKDLINGNDIVEYTDCAEMRAHIDLCGSAGKLWESK